MLVLSLKFPPASGDRDMCLSWSRSPSTSWFACFMYVVHLNMAALKDSGGQNGLYLLEAQMSWFLLCRAVLLLMLQKYSIQPESKQNHLKAECPPLCSLALFN